ncbi:class I SAM-dependent rRNA methyltransferase [Salibacteraceae bacterium]|nr:class I SAM-dependent rRNA methyltransferase [Salibacteraceae bacterium]
MIYPWVKINRGREKSIERFHPWVFSGSINSAERELQEGELVKLVDSEDEFLAIGHCFSGSLAVKILSFEDVEIDQSWFNEQIESAISRRNTLNLPSEETNAYRLVHAEGDGLAGLIIDIYKDVAVIQPHSVGMEQSLDLIVNSLKKFGFSKIVHNPVGKGETITLAGEVSERVEVLENEAKYFVDPINGQKTGFFLDQRENRFLLRNYAQDKSVLNVFSYTGGFSISALLGGAKQVLSLDSASAALDICEENARLNNLESKHNTIKADALVYLQKMQDKFDVIVLDPPAFAKHKSARHNAIQAYRRINEAAINALEKGGILFTFSCSQVVTQQLFYDTIASAAMNSKRKVSVLHRLRQPADHPVSLFHPEGEYLKGLVLRID